MSNICGNCQYSRYDRESEDFVCNNPEAEEYAEWVEYSHGCEEWVSK